MSKNLPGRDLRELEPEDGAFLTYQNRKYFVYCVPEIAHHLTLLEVAMRLGKTAGRRLHLNILFEHQKNVLREHKELEPDGD